MYLHKPQKILHSFQQNKYLILLQFLILLLYLHTRIYVQELIYLSNHKK